MTTTPPRKATRRPYPSSSPSTPSPKRTRLSSPSWTVPSDSPSNPFTRGQRPSQEALNVPLPTSFSKHLPLYMRLVRDAEEKEEFRVVQVPANYTIRHLRSLLLYLFEGQMGDDEGEGRGKGHLFKVMKKMVLEGSGGEGDEEGKTKIKDGLVWARLSSVRDEEEEDEEEGERGEWRWESEDDFKVDNIWPDGLDLERGVVYQHDSGVEIHITINTISLPRRRGKGNEPFVFLGGGAAVRKRWNKSGGFADYLKRIARIGRRVKVASSEPPSSPVIGPPPTSSPSTIAVEETPPHPIEGTHRMDRAKRRISRLSKRFQSDEEGEDVFEGGFSASSEEEVDELEE